MNEYPTEEDLVRIREWPGDWTALLEFVRSIWHWSDWGIHVEDGVWHVSTGGWSGNEEIIGAMRDNQMFWMMTWESSRRGGHYTFKEAS